MALALWLAALATGAPRLAVLGSVLGPGGELSGADVTAAARAAASYALDRQLVPAETFTVEAEARLRACRSELPCLERALLELGADELLWLVADQSEPPVSASGRIIRRGVGVAASRARELGRDTLLTRALEEEAAELLRRAGIQLGGRVHVDTSPPGARVQLFPAPGGPPLLPGTVLPEGRYTVLAEHDGHDSLRRDLVVRPGHDERLVLELEPETSLLTSPWFWAVLSAAAAGAVISAGVLLSQPEDPGPELCLGRPCPR